MLTQVSLKNFGPLEQIDWKNLGKINLVIGANGSGKTFLLKALYSGMRTIEEYKRGDDPRSAAEILANKLYWTFQPEKIGDLVTKGAKDSSLSYEMTLDKRKFSYSFGKDTAKQISSLENNVLPRESNSIFLPAKEILSLHHIILKSREQERSFGFDDTYYDLARALRPLSPVARLTLALNSTINGGKKRIIKKTNGGTFRFNTFTHMVGFTDALQLLEKILGGKIEYDETSGRWQFKKGNQKFPIGVTAEGIKKIAILDTLLSNDFLNEDSIIFIDEPEAALHPDAISQFMDILAILAELGIQFFLASHSYFVVKKLFLIAQKNNASIPVLYTSDTGGTYSNLKDGMPDNPIINESIRLYKEEVELALQ